MTISREAFRTVYPGWWLSIGVCISLASVAGTTFWGFGLLVEPLATEFGWSRSSIAGAVSLTLLISGCASPLVGHLVDRFGPRFVILVGSVATVGAYSLLARINQLWELFVLLALLAFFRTWIFYVPFTTLITRWFSKRRATAMGIATSGFGLGGLIFLPLMAEALTLVGWRAAFLLSAALVVIVNGTFLLFARNDPPERWTAHEHDISPDGGSLRDGIIEIEDMARISRTPIFWIMAAGFALFFFAQWAFLFHGPQFFEHSGLSSRHAAFVLSAAAGLGVCVRLMSGQLIAKVTRTELLAGAVLFLMAFALLVLINGVSLPFLLGFALLWGIGSGIGPALEPLLVARVFGHRHYATVYGTMDGIDTVLSIPGPWVGGILFDLTGSFSPVLMLFGTAFVVGATGFIALARMISQKTERAEHVKTLSSTPQASEA